MEKEGTGTSTNCSASCGARSDARCGMVSSRVIVGTSITCSATTGSVTKNWTTSDNWSTICNHRHGYEGLDDRLHGGPQNPCLRTSHLRQRWRPTPAELLIKDVEELGLPATGCLLAPWRSGGAFQPGPLRRSSVRAEATNGGVAPSSALRSLR